MTSATVSGPIQKTSVGEDSTSDVMEVEDSGLPAESQLDDDLQRLKEEEQALLQQQQALEGTNDDIAALENQDYLRHNQNQQQAILKRKLRIQQALLRQPGAQAQEAIALRPQYPASSTMPLQIAYQTAPTQEQVTGAAALAYMADVATHLAAQAHSTMQSYPAGASHSSLPPTLESDEPASSAGVRQRPGLIQVVGSQSRASPSGSNTVSPELRDSRRRACTVRVTNAHSADAIETDV